MKTISSRFAWILTLLTGILLVFIGSRFLIAPLTGEEGFGIHVPVNGNYSFHYIKGIRDLAVGLLFIVLLLAREWKSIGLAMLCIVIVPVTDFLIVLNTPGHPTARLYPHLTAVAIALYLGCYYLIMPGKSRSRKGSN